ncbi:hypothetical protein JXM83_00240 [Candidatus Woesearchaeota archaeon]|nr:hypothetical protein [Candidatus Woesearchaeota archaeon]
MKHIATKREDSGFNFVRILGRVFRPKKYRLLVLESYSKSFLFYSMIILIATVFTLIFNYDSLFALNFTIEVPAQNSSVDVFQNTFLLESVLKLFDNPVKFFMFVFPSVFLYLFFYLFFKYVAIALVASLLFFILSGFFKIHVGFSKIFKINLFSIVIMIFFEALGIPFYSTFQVPLLLYLVLSSLALFFVGSSSA